MVVYRAVLDCQGKMSDIKTDYGRRRAAKDAKQWIASADCQSFCDYIDVDHGAVMQAAEIDHQ